MNLACLVEPDEHARRRLIEQRDLLMNLSRTEENRIPQDRSVKPSPVPYG